MKQIALYLTLALSTIGIGCEEKAKKLGDFKLLPLPQEFSIQGASDIQVADIKAVYIEGEIKLATLGKAFEDIEETSDKSAAIVSSSVDPSLDLKDQGYELEINDSEVTITAKDKAGLFYAFQTLGQLMTDARDQGVTLPKCKIKDYPKLAYRSVHWDIKHHLEKTSYYYDLLDKLASYKINGIIVELEDKLKYKRQPKVGSADALSIEEWKKLSEYANDCFIQISPLVQGLGHSSFVLKHDEYKHLRDDPESDWAYNPLDPETYQVQFDLYLDAIEATPYGKYLHVGGDEVHTTGRNSGKSSLELQLEWLNKVSKFAEEHNRIPIFWDDMPLKDAGVYRAMFNTKLTEEEVSKIWEENEPKLLKFLDLFPKNCIYMRWNYSSSHAIGNAKAMEWFMDHDLPVMGATAGQTRWVLMPQKESNMENIKNFAVSSIANNLDGLLLTLWDDDSPHFELYMRGILAFSEYTWSGELRSKNDIKTAYRQRQFGHTVSDPAFAFIDTLEVPVAQWKNILLIGNARNKLKKNNNAIEEMVIEMPDLLNKGKWTESNADRLKNAEKMLSICNGISDKIAAMKSNAIRNQYNLEVYEQVNELMKFTYSTLLVLRDFDQTKSEDGLSEVTVKLSELENRFLQVRSKFEEVYGKTRILTKPENYILDQDGHSHLANQSTTFDWQFYAEMLFFEKLNKELLN